MPPEISSPLSTFSSDGCLVIHDGVGRIETSPLCHLGVQVIWPPVQKRIAGLQARLMRCINGDVSVPIQSDGLRWSPDGMSARGKE